MRINDIVQFTLPNGIRVIHRYSTSPVCYCGLTIGAGTRDEFENEHGAAHFLEHVLFKGTEKRKAYHINNRLESVGGELNAFTTKEETAIHASVLNTDFGRAIELISDITFNSIFPEKEISKEKIIICEEIDSYNDSPAELIFDDFEDLLFQSSSLGRNILGTKANVKKMTGTKLKSFLQRTYNTDKMVFSSIGKIPESRLIYYCNKYLGVQKENPRKFEENIVPEYIPFKKQIRKNTYQSHVLLGGRAYKMNDSRNATLALLINILGGPSANSVLNTVIREKYGLVYSIDAGHSTYRDTGCFTIYFGTAKNNLEKTKELVFHEMDRICNTKMSEFALAKAKKQFIGQFLIAADNNEVHMLSMGKELLNIGKCEEKMEVIERIKTVNTSDILNIAQDIFNPTTISELIYS